MPSHSLHACQDCIHYRYAVPLSSVLKAQVSESHEDVLKAVDEISAQDDAHRIQERAWISAGAQGDGVWPHRPRTISYCGLYEGDDHYYVCEVKNVDGKCRDFTRQHVTKPNDCGLCAHRLEAAGDAEDHALLYQIAERMAYSTVQSPPLQAEYQRLEKGVGVMKAYEIREAYRNYGWLPRPPKYLDCCAARSRPAHFEVSQCINSRHDCSRFLPGYGS